MDGFTFHRPHPKPTSARDTRQYIVAQIVVLRSSILASIHSIRSDCSIAKR